jgi:SAM-dependent methyltransferase
MSGFKDHFSATAVAYSAFRPTYPDALFEWLATLTERHELAVDCGCGNGQASVMLARHFDKVLAVDPSAEQIANAAPHERVQYLVAPAEEIPLPDRSVDLVIAAQALHWFDFEPFFVEVKRIGRKGAVFAGFTYGLMTISEPVDEVISHFYWDILRGYWPPERRHVDEGYRSIPFPFDEITPPAFSMEATWDLPRLIGYLGTWSAVKEYKAKNGSDPVAELSDELLAAWGDVPELKVSWPLVLRVGKVS